MNHSADPQPSRLFARWVRPFARGRVVVHASALLATLALATPAMAQPPESPQKFFGYERAQLGEIMRCNIDSIFHLGALALYDPAVDVDENVRRALAENGNSSRPLPDAEVETRMRNMHAAWPTSDVALGRKRFTDCLGASSIRTSADRGGRCWMVTFYFSMIVATERKHGRTAGQIVDRLAKPDASAGERARLEIIVDSFLQRSPDNAVVDSIKDVGLFLQCLEMTPGPTEFGYRHGLD